MKNKDNLNMLLSSKLHFVFCIQSGNARCKLLKCFTYNNNEVINKVPLSGIHRQQNCVTVKFYDKAPFLLVILTCFSVEQYKDKSA